MPTIKREVDEWYVIFSCEVPEPEKLPVSYEDVGIDLGVTHLATLSTGEMIEHPRSSRKAQKVLEKRQQALSRKKRGSHRREKARKLVAKAHRKSARQLVDRSPGRERDAATLSFLKGRLGRQGSSGGAPSCAPTTSYLT